MQQYRKQKEATPRLHRQKGRTHYQTLLPNQNRRKARLRHCRPGKRKHPQQPPLRARLCQPCWQMPQQLQASLRTQFGQPPRHHGDQPLRPGYPPRLRLPISQSARRISATKTPRSSIGPIAVRPNKSPRKMSSASPPVKRPSIRAISLVNAASPDKNSRLPCKIRGNMVS